jgi:MYXO-CTERM domain-containing protein
VGRGHPTSAAVVDVNNDGIDEVITSGLGGYPAIFPDTSRNPDVPNMVYASDGFGPLSNSHEGVVLAMMNSPTVADLDGDGKPDIIQGLVGAGIAGLVSQGGHRFKFEHVVGAWDIASGTFHDGFPAVVEDFQILQNFPVADVDGDGNAEALVATAGYFIHALRSDGSSPDHWPKFTGGFTLATPALGDIDGDGNLELAAITRDGNLFLWSLQGRMDSVQWAGFKHDSAGTGNRRLVELNTPAKDPPVDCGCSTTHTQSPSLGTWALMALVALLLGRRVRP